MPLYLYRAATPDGSIVRNKVEEINKQTLVKKLKRNNLLPISINQVRGVVVTQTGAKKRKNIADIDEIMKNANTTNLLKDKEEKVPFKEKVALAFGYSPKVPKRDLIIFTQNFYLLKKANFNNIHALSTIIQTTENWVFRGILEDILAGVEAGENMYTTMEYYEKVFPFIYINMIKVGELSGSLTNSLEQAVKYLEDSDTLGKRIRKILVPNIIQLVLLLVLLVVGSLVAIPAIQNVYASVGSTDTLHPVTLWFSDFINGLVKHWYLPAGVIAIIVTIIIGYINTPRGKYNFHYFKYTMPVFGKLIYLVDFSRLMKAMLLNLENGMRIQDALEVSKNVVNNYVMLSIVESSINNILMGGSWIEPFEKSGLSTAMETEMLKIGMQTDLNEMMAKLLEYIDVDINQTMDKIMAVMPQIVYSIVGIVLIFFTIVVLVPCIQVYMGNFLFSAYGV